MATEPRAPAHAARLHRLDLAGNWPEYRPIYRFLTIPPVVKSLKANHRLPLIFHGMEAAPLAVWFC
jgi:hypothetical protein